MNGFWGEALWQMGFAVGMAALFGSIFGQPLLFAFVGLAIYCAFFLYRLWQFSNWLIAGDLSSTSPGPGVWDDLAGRVIRMRRGAQQLESELRLQLDHCRDSTSALPDAVVSMNRMGEIQWFNSAAERLLGLRMPQDLHQRLVNLFRAPDLARYLSSKDFSEPLEVSAPGPMSRKLAIRVSESGYGAYLLVAQDITERYLSEQIRKDFVANVSHELRTPLTVIRGFVENMLYASPGMTPPQWEKPLQLMSDQAERMQEIVEDLLLLARLEGAAEDNKREAVDMELMIETIRGEAEALVGERSMQIKIDSDVEIAGDVAQLRSAFTNLVVNAINHTPAKAHITLSWTESGHTACFTVEDDGDGIPAEHLPRLTERFYRVDAGRSRERGGTGLGLAIVKHILQRHGATLEIHSVVGQGSQFSCCFPAQRLIWHTESLTSPA